MEFAANVVKVKVFTHLHLFVLVVKFVVHNICVYVYRIFNIKFQEKKKTFVL